MQQQPGTLIEGKYEILGKMGEGGMGAIYKVRHRLLDEIRVVKVMRPQVAVDEELKLRFIEEAKTATRLKHPNIGTIHDFALDEDGTAYLVMEFIDGVNLTELLALKGCPPVGLAVEIAHQTLLALGYLHRGNVVHRDIAPDNLMLTRDDEGRALVKVIDLGIAKTMDRPVEVTSTGVFLGKLKYASPEQYGSLPAGQRLDGRSDLYCLGLVLYELLTGARPFRGDTAAELLRAHLFEPPIPFSQADPKGKVPPELRAVILKALEKAREDRFSSAEEFDRELLTIRQRFPPPEKLERTVSLLPSILSAPGSQVMTVAPSATVTPSAQSRLNRQFVAQASTPYGEEGPQPASPASAASTAKRIESPEPTSRDVPSRKSARRPAWFSLAGGLLVLAAGLALLRPWARPRLHQPVEPPVAPVGTPGPAISAASEPSPQAIATAAPPEPTAPPSSVSISEEPAPAAVEETARLSRQAEEAHARAGRARQNAERARAPELAAGLYDFGRAQEKEGQRLVTQRNYAAARAAFDAGAGAFGQAEISSRKVSERRPSPVERIAVLPAPTVHPQPAPPAVSVNSAPPEPARVPSSPPAQAARAAPSDQEKIRQVLQEYERAQNTLDLNLYAQVYPALAGEARRSIENAWQGLKSQQLELEIRNIELKNSHAVVRAYQRLVAVPRVGGEQHDERERVFTLEKRGDTWVIVNLS